MIENKIEFYHSKWMLFLGVIFSLLFIGTGIFLVYVTSIQESIFVFLLVLFTIVLFSFFAVANILKMIRGYPYITVTEEYIQLDPFTKSEVTIYFTDIKTIKVTEASFQKILEIDLVDESDYFDRLSFHNKVRLFMNRVTGFSLFAISVRAIRKQDRAALLETLDFIIQKKQNHNTPIFEAVQKQHDETDFLTKYDPTPEVNRTIDRSYFIKSYRYSFFIFVLSFLFFYLFIIRDGNYLAYIIVSFIFYPFARVLTDWLFGFKLRHKLDKQKGVTYYVNQFMYLFDLFLFHVSFFIAPFGILFLVIRAIIIRIQQ